MGQLYLDRFYENDEFNSIKNAARDKVEKKYKIGKYDKGKNNTNIFIEDGDTQSERMAK